MSSFVAILISLLYLLCFLIVCMAPGLLIFGTLFWRRFYKIKRRKTVIALYSLFSSLLAPISVYLVFYHFTEGWTDENSLIFLYVILGFPFYLAALIGAFAYMSYLKKRGQMKE